MVLLNTSKRERVYVRAVNRHGYMVDIATIDPGDHWPTPATPKPTRQLFKDLEDSLFAFTDGGIANLLVVPDDVAPAVIRTHARR